MSDDTTPVRFTVIGLELVTDAGRLVALAIIEIEIAGVSLTLQGVQVRRNAAGGLSVVAPQFRHPRTGRWVPGVLLPEELASAMAGEVMDAWAAAEAAGSVPPAGRPR